MSTIKEALKQGFEKLKPNVENPLQESLILLAHTTAKSKEFLIAHDEENLSPNLVQRFHLYLKRRSSGEPLAYITGQKEFWSLSLDITSDVLIPRPETELLVEVTLSIASKLRQQTIQILDLGTGSGCIAVALAQELSHAQITACDNSEASILVAKQNAKKHKLNNINFVLSNWFTNITQNNFDIIVSNPPYIAHKDLNTEKNVTKFEPASALFSDDNGLADCRMIIQKAQQYLSNEGVLILEHGFEQAISVRKFFARQYYSHIETLQDLQQHDRVTLGFNAPI